MALAGERARGRRSRSFFEPPALEGGAGAPGSSGVPAEAGQPTPSVALGRKIDKLSKLTGRRGSLSEIRPLLESRTVEQARTNAQSLYAVEKLKKRYGDRPVVDTAAAADAVPDVRSPTAAAPHTAPGTPRGPAAPAQRTSPPGAHNKRRKNKDKK